MKYLILLMGIVVMLELVFIGYYQGKVDAYLQFQKELESKK